MNVNASQIWCYIDMYDDNNLPFIVNDNLLVMSDNISCVVTLIKSDKFSLNDNNYVSNLQPPKLTLASHRHNGRFTSTSYGGPEVPITITK